jgi:hypothetical protein
MKLSIFAVSALVLSTSFAAVGWADGHPTQGEVTNPGAGGKLLSGVAVANTGVRSVAAGGTGHVDDLIRPSNIAGTPAGGTKDGDGGLPY